MEQPEAVTTVGNMGRIEDEEAVTTIGLVVGQNVRRLRGDRLQEQVAVAMRDYGFWWNQATIAGIETGRRQVQIVEMASLCGVLGCSIYDLLNEAVFDLEETVHVETDADHIPAPLSTVRWLLHGGDHGFDPALVTGPPKQAKGRTPAAEKTVDERQQEANELLMGVGEAERKAARKLGINPLKISSAAFTLWGRSLTEERDRIVAEKAPADAPRRSVQAIRGRVTRELVEEIAEQLEETRG